MEAFFRALITTPSRSEPQVGPIAASLMLHINSDLDQTNTAEKKLAHFKWLLSNPNLADLTVDDLLGVFYQLADSNWLDGLALFKEALLRVPSTTILAAGRQYAIKFLDIPKVANTLAFLSAGLVGSESDYALLVPDPESYLAMLQNNSQASLLQFFRTGRLDAVRAAFEAKYHLASLMWTFEVKGPDCKEYIEYMVNSSSEQDLINVIVLGNIKSRQMTTVLRLRSWPALVAAVLVNITNGQEMLELLQLESAKTIPVSVLNQFLTILTSQIIPTDLDLANASLNNCFNKAILAVIGSKLANKVSQAYRKGRVLSSQSKVGWDNDILALIKRLVELGGDLPPNCHNLISKDVTVSISGPDLTLTNQAVDEALEELYSA